MGRRLRHGHDFSPHPRERHNDAGLRGGSTAPLVAEPTRVNERGAHIAALAEQGLDTLAELAREANRDCHARMVGARLDRAQRLARDSRTPRELGLSEIPRDSRLRQGSPGNCHNTCQSALNMAYTSLS